MTEIWFANDLHSHVPAGVATLDAIAHARDAGAITVDGGDLFGGGAFHAFTGGAIEREVAAACFDVRAVGNHDLESAGPALAGMLCANVSGGPFVRVQRFERGGRAIAIAGVIGDRAFAATPVRARPGLAASPVVDVLDAMIPELLATADHVVVVSHSGFTADLELAERYPGLDAILSAHCHSAHTVAYVGDVAVAKAREHGRGYGKLALGGRRAAVELVEPARTERFTHPALRHLDAALAAFTAHYGRAICTIAPDFVAAHPTREAQLTSLAGDLVAACDGAICVLNVYALRAELASGSLSLEQLHDRLPFDDQLRLVPCAALPAGWVARLAEHDEPTVCVERATRDVAACCTTDYVLENLLAVAADPTWPALGTLRSFVAHRFGAAP